MKDDRTKELLGQLESGIDKLTSSDEWKRYLATMAKFHRYSFGNVMLIMFQRPDATQVMGYGSRDKKTGKPKSGWLSVGRHVKDGGAEPHTHPGQPGTCEKQHGIWILAPITVKAEDEGNPGQKREKLIGWKSVPVFDVSQTDGEPLPEPVKLLQGEGPVDLYEHLIATALDLGATSVTTGADLGQANGVTHQDGRIEISQDRSGLQQIKTLVHEIAHWNLGHLADGPVTHRGVAELEAESVAYVVLGQLGIDTGDYSFGYVAGWSKDDAEEARKGIRASAGRIQKAVTAITASLDKCRNCGCEAKGMELAV
jgi:hypothetical protein